MRICKLAFFLILTVLCPLQCWSEEDEPNISQRAFTPFTGKVAGNKVRLRAKPSLEAPIVKELSINQVLMVLDEIDEFYAVRPETGTKTYIFRTFVLDDIVEGSRVNVRLQPDLDSPVIAQLNTGDHVDGTISPKNNKWLEIPAPESARLYVAKEYIDNIGGPELFHRREKRTLRIHEMLTNAQKETYEQLNKSYPDIDLSSVISNLKSITEDREDFPHQASDASKLLAMIEDTLLKKKLAYLEARTQTDETNTHELKEEVYAQKEHVRELKQKLNRRERSTKGTSSSHSLHRRSTITAKMHAWVPLEEKRFQQWLNQQAEQKSIRDFYQAEKENATALRGVVEPYHHTVRNRPGDYLLVNKYNNLPRAYLYSTQINLEDYIGQEIVIRGVSRPNNNFAFPAYYVLEIE